MTTGTWAVWPEGMPEAARFTSFPSRALLLQNAMMLALLTAFGVPQRIVVHYDPAGRPDPEILDVRDTPVERI